MRASFYDLFDDAALVAADLSNAESEATATKEKPCSWYQSVRP
jgi:hypothetical protein